MAKIVLLIINFIVITFCYSQIKVNLDITDTLQLKTFSEGLNFENSSHINIIEPGVPCSEIYELRLFSIISALKEYNRIALVDQEIDPIILGQISFDWAKNKENLEQLIKYLDLSYYGVIPSKSLQKYYYFCLKLFFEKRLLINNDLQSFSIIDGRFLRYIVDKELKDDSINKSLTSLFTYNNENFQAEWKAIEPKIKNLMNDTTSYHGLLYHSLLNYYETLVSTSEINSNSEGFIYFNSMFQKKLQNLYDPRLFLNFTSFSQKNQINANINVLIGIDRGKIINHNFSKKYKSNFGNKSSQIFNPTFTDKNEDNINVALFSDKNLMPKMSIRVYTFRNNKRIKIKVNPLNYDKLILIDEIGRLDKIFYTTEW
jgi:hypothetical protein